jgi:hypothetical protein
LKEGVHIHKAAWQVAADGDAVISSVQALDFSSDEVPSLIFIRPKSAKRRNFATVYIPTAFLAGQLASRVLVDSELHKLFSRLTIHPDNWTASRWLYENFVHAQLTTPRELEVLDNEENKVIIHKKWKFIPRPVALLGETVPPLYWRPAQGDFPGIDAVLRTGTETWAIQVTVGNRYGTAEEGLAEILDALGDKAKHEMRLLIVGPDTQMVRSAVTGMTP